MPHSIDMPEALISAVAVYDKDTATQNAPTLRSDPCPESHREDAPMDCEDDVELEDLFQDDDDDVVTSILDAPGYDDHTIDSAQVASAFLAPSMTHTDPEVMLSFYQRLFPFRYLFQWLNHSVKPSDDFRHREFAFTLQNEAYLRYQAFATGDLLRKDVLRLNPLRFEIGPVYTTNPRDRKSLRKASAFKPISKELVFDIDLTDYDDIRTCCDKTNICSKCWTFVTMAIQVIDAALRQDFGFVHILWVYSGRRGAHAWISDSRARNMDDTRRRSIAGYLELLKGGDKGGKKVNIKRSSTSSELHPHLARSLEILKPHFAGTILQVQDPFRSEAGAERLLSFLPDKVFTDCLRKKWHADPGRSSSLKWTDINTLAESGVSKTLDQKSLLEAKQDIVLEYTYPRLDVEVSKKLNHLLKSPFVVHPKTGRVCVPIDPDKIYQFDFQKVPTVSELLAQVDSHDRNMSTEEKNVNVDRPNRGPETMVGTTTLQDYEKTSLRPYMDHFKAHVSSLIKAEQRSRRVTSEGEMEF